MTDQVRRDETNPTPLDAAATPPPTPTDDPNWAPPDQPTTDLTTQPKPTSPASQTSKPARPVRPVVPVVRKNAPAGNGAGAGNGAAPRHSGWPQAHPGQVGRPGPPVGPWAQPPRPPSVRAVPAGWRVMPLPPTGQPAGQPGQVGHPGFPPHPGHPGVTGAWPRANGANGATHANGWPRSGTVDPWQRFVTTGRPVYREPYPVRAKAFLAGLGAGAVWFGMFAAVSWSARSYAWTAVVAGALAALAAVVLGRFGDRGVAIGVTIATAIGLGIAGIVVTAYGFGGTWLFW